MNLRYLLLAPALGLSSLFTACETTTVAYESGPAYADYDDTDFYYVSGSPYSHRYGVLVLRDGGYYYSRGGRYYAYSRHGYHHDHDNYRRYDHDHDRDRVVYNNRTYNNTYRTNAVRTQPSARYSTTNRAYAGGYHGTNTATRTNVNVQRTGVRTNTQVQARAGAQPAQVQVKKGKHGDHDHDRD